MELVNLFIEGGFIMYPLLIFSVLTIIVWIDKTLFLRSFQKQLRKLEENFERDHLNKGIENFKEDFDKIHPIVSLPYQTFVEWSKEERNKIKEVVERQVDKTDEHLRKRLWILGTIASSAPFVGLFGTVVGIIKSFQSIGEAGKGGFAIVAAGLSEALIATAAGIIVAVIAVLLFNYLKVKIGEVIFDYKFNLENTIDNLLRRK